MINFPLTNSIYGIGISPSHSKATRIPILLCLKFPALIQKICNTPQKDTIKHGMFKNLTKKLKKNSKIEPMSKTSDKERKSSNKNLFTNSKFSNMKTKSWEDKGTANIARNLLAASYKWHIQKSKTKSN